MSKLNLCLNCGAEKSLGYETCISCGSNFKDEERKYKTEKEKRIRIRELTQQKRKERKEYLKSEEAKQAARARDKWAKKEYFSGLFSGISIIYGIIAIGSLIIPGILLLFLAPGIGIVVLILAIFFVMVYIVYKRHKIARRNEFTAKQRKEYLIKEELHKYCDNCGDLVLERLRTCPNCGHEFSIDI